MQSQTMSKSCIHQDNSSDYTSNADCKTKMMSYEDVTVNEENNIPDNSDAELENCNLRDNGTSGPYKTENISYEDTRDSGELI